MSDRADSWDQFENHRKSFADARSTELHAGLSFQTILGRLRQSQTPAVAAFHPTTMSKTQAHCYSLYGFDKLSPNGNGQASIQGQFMTKPF
jgi:hypothetical protein